MSDDLVSKNNITIMCGKCRKQVDSLVREYNPNLDTITYTVTCHGEQESSVLTSMNMLDCYSIEGATAFVQLIAIGEKHER